MTTNDQPSELLRLAVLERRADALEEQVGRYPAGNNVKAGASDLRGIEELSRKCDELTRQVREIGDALRLERRLLRQQMLGSSTPLGGGRMLTRICTGQDMLIDHRDTGSGLRLLREGKFEAQVMRFMQKFLQPGTTFLDIGANFGFYSLFAGIQIGPGGKVYAFEANPFLKDFIRSNAFINGLAGRVTLVNKAVSDSVGAAEFSFSYAGIGGGQLGKGNSSEQDNQTISVPLTTVDAELPPGEVIACAKLDVEGAEARTLRGMAGTIARSPDVVLVIEFFPALHPTDRGAEILSVLEEQGLAYWRIDHRGRLESVTREDLVGGAGCYLAASRRRPDDRTLKIDRSALVIDGSLDQDGFLVAPARAPLCHGPYWFLAAGRYEISIVGERSGELQASFTHEAGHNISTSTLPEGQSRFRVDFPDDVRYFEVVLRSAGPATRLKLERIDVVEVR